MRSTKRPFWQQAAPSAKPAASKLRGTHEQLLAAAEDGARVWPYDRAAQYQVGELLLHGVFGLGVVVEAPGPGKVTVRFEAGDKLLACGASH